MNEITAEDLEVCSECHRLFDPNTGERPVKYHTIFIITSGIYMCNGCKENYDKSLG